MKSLLSFLAGRRRNVDRRDMDASIADALLRTAELYKKATALIKKCQKKPCSASVLLECARAVEAYGKALHSIPNVDEKPPVLTFTIVPPVDQRKGMDLINDLYAEASDLEGIGNTTNQRAIEILRAAADRLSYLERDGEQP